MRPEQIEHRSMEIIEEELVSRGLLEKIDPAVLDVVKRVIHTSADFDFATSMEFTPTAVASGLEALKAGSSIICDTNMIVAGVSKPAMRSLDVEAFSLVADPTVAAEAKERGVTRSTVAMEHALKDHPASIVAVGNAPTALFALRDMLAANPDLAAPALIIGVPVGFVNVVESKEVVQALEVPSIVAKGRKGGSTIAVAILNALLYRLYQRA